MCYNLNASTRYSYHLISDDLDNAWSSNLWSDKTEYIKFNPLVFYPIICISAWIIHDMT